MWKAHMDMRALPRQDLKIFSINREAVCISYWCFSTTQREEPFIVIPAHTLIWGRGWCDCSSFLFPSQQFFQCLPIIIIDFLIPLKFFLIKFPSSSFLIIFFYLNVIGIWRWSKALRLPYFWSKERNLGTSLWDIHEDIYKRFNLRHLNGWTQSS